LAGGAVRILDATEWHIRREFMGKLKHRIEKNHGQSIRNWEKINSPVTKKMKPNSFSEMGLNLNSYWTNMQIN